MQMADDALTITIALVKWRTVKSRTNHTTHTTISKISKIPKTLTAILKLIANIIIVPVRV